MTNFRLLASTALLASAFVLGATASAQDAKPASPTPPPTTVAPAAAEMTYVVLRTSKGDILLELDTAKAPTSVANFLDYTKSGHYDGTVFHRVIKGFMIQGGGFTEQGQQKKTKAGIKNEWQNGLKNTRGTIAMARLGGQADSGTSQFFINHKDNPSLDRPNDGAGYAVFGRVVSGMDVVDAIAESPTTIKNGMRDWPATNVTLTKAEVLSKDDAMKMMDAKAKPTAPANAAQIGRAHV